jgi:DHA3 family macrolide efflux protein-like MFS transporter
MFVGGLTIPILNGSNQAIWQRKVAPDVQGRVFSVRRWIAQISAPVAMLAAGPLADNVFEPAMMEGGSLVPLLGGLVGTGPGAGMAAIFLITGALGIFSGVVGYLVPMVRNVEELLPDHEAEALPVEEDAEQMEPAPAAEAAPGD